MPRLYHRHSVASQQQLDLSIPFDIVLLILSTDYSNSGDDHGTPVVVVTAHVTHMNNQYYDTPVESEIYSDVGIYCSERYRLVVGYAANTS